MSPARLPLRHPGQSRLYRSPYGYTKMCLTHFTRGPRVTVAEGGRPPPNWADTFTAGSLGSDSFNLSSESEAKSIKCYNIVVVFFLIQLIAICAIYSAVLWVIVVITTAIANFLPVGIPCALVFPSAATPRPLTHLAGFGGINNL
jgi:hypothetical protein